VDNYSKRKYLLGAVFILVALVFCIKLFRLQVVNSSYKQYATRNVLRRVINYPARGLIYDRNGELLVYNKASYDLLVTPREVSTFDTISLCQILDIEKEELIEGLNKAKKYSRYKPSVVVKQLSSENYAVLQEKLFRFPGFFVQTRTLREYPRKTAAHVLGYVGEVDRSTIEKEPYYAQGDYIGVIGIENAYEEELRGRKGINFQLVDVHNRIKGSYAEGLSDTAAILGSNLTTTLDADLQAYAEYLMHNKKGSVVAIEPATGEVLAFVSAPTYDPSLLVGRERGANFQKLVTDTLQPIFNRAIRAAYPPGSTFKLVNSLIALEVGAITEHTSFSCSGQGSKPIRCTHNHESPIRIRNAIRESCNSFFWNTYSAIMKKSPRVSDAYKVWRNHVLSFGLSSRLGTEFTNELPGNIPESTYYDFYYGANRWNALTIRSMAIGQGELLITPFQLANVVATIANRGYYISPHLVRSVWDVKNEPTGLSFERHETAISKEHYELVIEGMQAMVEETSARYYSKLDSIIICGKTGTVQNPHGSDHSVFIAFAPKDNPKIALSVYIEHGVWGGRYAAPIASLIIEKYLNDSIAPRRLATEERMRNANLLNPNQPK
jgi:penicillin-binding protein 2